MGSKERDEFILASIEESIEARARIRELEYEIKLAKEREDDQD